MNTVTFTVLVKDDRCKKKCNYITSQPTNIRHYIKRKKRKKKKGKKINNGTYLNSLVIQHYSELRSCVKVVVAVLGTPSVIVVMISVGITQQ